MEVKVKKENPILLKFTKKSMFKLKIKSSSIITSKYFIAYTLSTLLSIQKISCFKSIVVLFGTIYLLFFALTTTC